MSTFFCVVKRCAWDGFLQGKTSFESSPSCVLFYFCSVVLELELLNVFPNKEGDNPRGDMGIAGTSHLILALSIFGCQSLPFVFPLSSPLLSILNSLEIDPRVTKAQFKREHPLNKKPVLELGISVHLLTLHSSKASFCLMYNWLNA